MEFIIHCNFTDEIYNKSTEKIKKKYGALGNIVRAYVQRDGNSSMGLALAGYKDRNKMGCFVAGINPKGTASSQNIKVGDEILEVIVENFLKNATKLNTTYN